MEGNFDESEPQIGDYMNWGPGVKP